MSSSGKALRFVPKISSLPRDGDVDRFRAELAKLKRLVVLTGAGVSTESGIPDYRSPRAPGRSKPKPTTIQEFLKSPEVRQRYWARNFVAWPAFEATQPNQTHLALAEAEHAGHLHWLITQNVDTLHHKAGSINVTELHGNSHVVKCLKCDARLSRPYFQQRMEELNPDWSAEAREIAPDGDVVIPEELISQFKTPWCETCGPQEGIFKTDVVFFGDNVPKRVVEFCSQKVMESDGLLVLGSSLEVFSGFRFVRQTLEQGKPLFIVNIGPTRADPLCSTLNKLSCKCSDVVPTFFSPLN
uniref:Deacetylase sirtuin-type domain-containing protein n=1 Tax=Plectus sambesii TaxID=2011161 RepID=A0A914VFL5_9BILA